LRRKEAPSRGDPEEDTITWRVQHISTEMGRQVASVLYVVAMAAIIVGVDFMFFRSRFWERLIVNIGIVLVFAAFYFRFLRRP
jgi:type IV secretory pathway VirB2 component (pilin)